MEKEVLQNHELYLERKKLYESYGFDIEKERKFILDKAEPLSGDILEVGTGKGHFTLILAQAGYKFTSIDISEEEQKLARLNLKYFGLENSVNFRIENAEHLSFKDKSFDIIFSVNTVHHLDNPFRVMDELVRIIAFKGKMVLSDFNKTGLEMLDQIHAREYRVHRAAKFSLQDMNRFFWEKGFKTEEYNSKFQKMLIIHRQIV